MDGDSFAQQQNLFEAQTFAMALDVEHGRVFFTDFAADQLHIRRINLDGTGLTTLIDLDGADGAASSPLAIDSVADRLYWVAGESIWSSDLNGGDTRLAIAGAGRVGFLVVTQVPEPGTLFLGGAALSSLVVLAVRTRRRRVGHRSRAARVGV